MGTHWVPGSLLAGVAGVMLMAWTVPVALATVTTTLPTDDTYVRGGASANQNFDSDSYLRVKNASGEDNDRNTLLRFDLSGVQGVVLSATLRLYCRGLTNGTPTAAFVYSVEDDGWQEDTVTWNTAPPAVALLTEKTDINTVGETYSFDVTSFVAQELQGDGVVSLLLRDDIEVKKAVDFDRREDPHPPVLEIETLEEYTLSLDVFGAGQVTLSPPGNAYPPGTEVTLTALPDAGWQLASWSGDLTGTLNPATLVMDSDKSVWAAFEPIPQVTLQLQVNGIGSVSLDPPGGTYSQGTVVQLTALPAANWSFDAWEGDLLGSTNPQSLVMDTSKSVTANFSTSVSVTTPVKLKQVASGGASDTNQVSTSTVVEAKDGQLYLAAVSMTPVQDVSSISGLGLTWNLLQSQCSARGGTGVSLWMAQGVSAADSPVTATLADSVQQAVLVVSRYIGVHPTQPLGELVAGNTLGASGPCEGGIDSAVYSLVPPSTGTEGVVVGCIAHGDRTHTPGSGWTERLETTWGPLGGAASLSLVDRTLAPGWTLQGSFDGDADWAAVAVEIRPAPASVLDLTISGLGSVTLDPPGGIYPAEAIVTLQAEPQAGSFFVGWGGDLSGTADPLSVLMNCNVEALAMFSTVPYHDLHLDVDGAGYVHVAPTGRRFAEGTQLSLTAEPLPGWIFTGWSGDVAGGTPTQLLAIDADRQVTAHFRFSGIPTMGLWTSAAELESAPMDGDAWNEVWDAANQSFYPPDVGDQNSMHNVDCLAAAIVYARTGDTSFRDRVVQALDYLAGVGDPGSTTLAWGREVGAFVLAADLIGYSNPDFDTWLRQIAETYVGTDGRTLLQTFEERPNNWGTNAFGTLVAIYAYLQDQSQLQFVHDYWVQGVTGVPPLGVFGELSWQYDPLRPRCINPPRVSRMGLDIDGAIADDVRRGGPLEVPPIHTGYPWGAMQGIVMGARILERVDPALAIWHVEERAIYRATELLQVRWEQQFGGWAAEGDDMWMIPFLDAAYGTSWSTGARDEWRFGKNAGWAYVLLGDSQGGSPTSTAGEIRPAFHLYPGTPSPFSHSTDIRFSLPLDGPVRVTIFNAFGRRVAVLLDRTWPAGMHHVRWDGTNGSGRPVASGVYWCRMQAGAHSETIRLVLLR